MPAERQPSGARDAPGVPDQLLDADPAADDADSWPKRLWRAFGAFRRHRMTDHGAGLTYYLLLSLFPALLVGISLLSFLGQQSTVVSATEYLRNAGAPAQVVDAVEASLRTLVESSGAKAGIGLVIGLLLGLNAASGAFAAAGRALNVAFGVDDQDEDQQDGKPVVGAAIGFVRGRARQIAFTLLLILLAVISLVSIFLGGDVARDLFGAIGLGETAGAVWIYVRWVVALASTMVIFAVIYAFASERHPRRFQWISPGAVLGVLIWIAASALFFFYVSNFGDYGATYGAFSGAIVLLLWLYITSLAFLLGGEVNAEVERSQTAGRGGPPPPSPPPMPGMAQPVVPAPVSARDAADD